MHLYMVPELRMECMARNPADCRHRRRSGAHFPEAIPKRSPMDTLDSSIASIQSKTTKPNKATADVESAKPAWPNPASFTIVDAIAMLTKMDATLTIIGMRASFNA